MFARLDFPRFLVCCSGDLSGNESEEKPSVAICGGSICILTGLYNRPIEVCPQSISHQHRTSIGPNSVKSVLKNPNFAPISP